MSPRISPRISWRVPAGPATAGFVLAATVVSVVASASGHVDGGEARLCRLALPALEPGGTRISDLHVKSARPGVRIDYAARPPDGPAAPHYALCRFAPGGGRELAAVTTDRGEVSSASVFLLRRYYLDTPDGAAGAPEAG